MPLPSSILFIAPALTLSGTTERLRRSAELLAESGVRVTIAASSGARSGEFDSLGVELVGWEGAVRPWQLPFVAGRLRRLAGAVEAEIVHVVGSELAQLGARLGLPYILELRRPARQRIAYHSRNLRAVLLPSKTLQESVVNRGRLPRGRIRLLAHGPARPAEAVRPLSRSGPACIGCVSGLFEGAGLTTFLRSARLLLQGGHAAKFLVMGEGKEEVKIRRLARDLALGQSLLFNAPAAPATAELLRQLDVFVDPRLDGAPGWLAHESLALGLPCVLTAVQGSFEVARDGEDALLVPHDDPTALAGALKGLLHDPPRTISMGALARERYLEREESAFVESLLAVYTEAVREPETAPA